MVPRFARAVLRSGSSGSKRVRNDPEDLQVMVTKANSIKGFRYVECDIISPKHLRESALIQLPVVRGNIPSTDHKDYVRDLFNNIFNSV